MMNTYLIAGTMTRTGKLPQGTWTLKVQNPSSAKVLLLGYVGDGLTSWSDGVEFTKHTSKDHLVCFPATADSAITVGAYAGHVGLPYEDPGDTSGAFRSYSSRGKRIDGVSIMDLAAPDNPVVPLPRMKGLTELGTHMIYGGTSGAGPHVAGAVALVKQHAPSLDGLAVRDALRKGALADAQVGSVPSDSWGQGKLRIYSSIYGKDPPANTPPVVRLKVDGPVHAGVPVTLTPEATDAEGGALEARWDQGYDGTYEGDFAPLGPHEVTFAEPGWHRVKVEVRDSGGLTAAAAVLVDVTPPPADTTPAADGGTGAGMSDGDGGCGCAVGAAPVGGGALALLLLLGLVAWSRPRRRTR
jgi:MYXO-CTERM domain-containing protein